MATTGVIAPVIGSSAPLGTAPIISTSVQESQRGNIGVVGGYQPNTQQNNPMSTVNQQFANLIAEQAIITPSTQAVKSAATTINPTVMQSTTPLRVNVINPDAVPYSSSAGVGGAGVPQGNTPATILSTGLAQTMGVPVGTVVPSGTTITPSTGKVVMPAVISTKSPTANITSTPSVITTPASTPATPAARPLAPAVPSTPGFSDGTQVLVTYTDGSTAIMTNARVQAMAAEGGLAAFSIVGYTIIPKGQQIPATAIVSQQSASSQSLLSNAGLITIAPSAVNSQGKAIAPITNNDGSITFTPTGNVPTDLAALSKMGASPAVIAVYMSLYGQGWNYNIASQGMSQNVPNGVSPTGQLLTKNTPGMSQAEAIAVQILNNAGITQKTVSQGYYVFMNQSTGQQVRIPSSVYDSSTPQQQFSLQQSLGNIPKNATIQINPDGTWTYSTGAVYTSVPAFTKPLLDYLRTNDPDVYAYVQQNGIVAAMNKYGDIINGAVSVLNAQGVTVLGSPGLNVSGIQPQLGLQTTINNMSQDLQNAYYQVMNKGGNQQAALTAIQTSAQQVITTFAQNQNVKITSASSLTQRDVNSLVAAGINTAYLAATGVTNTMINNAVAAYNQATLNSFLAQLSTEPQVLQNAYNSAAKAGGVTAGLLAYELALTSMKEAYSGIVTQLNSYYQKTNQVSISPNATNINPLDAMAAGVTQAQWLAAGLDAVEPYATAQNAYNQLKPYMSEITIPTMGLAGSKPLDATVINWQQYITNNPTKVAVQTLKDANFPQPVINAAQTLADTISQKVSEWSKGQISNEDYQLMGNNADSLGFITPSSPGVVKGFIANIVGSQGLFPGSAASIKPSEMPTFFNSLTKSQQNQLANAVISDPNGKNAFATFMETYNTAVKDNPAMLAGEIAMPFIPGGMIAASALMISSTVAKATTGQPVSKIEIGADAASVILGGLSIPIGNSVPLTASQAASDAARLGLDEGAIKGASFAIEQGVDSTSVKTIGSVLANVKIPVAIASVNNAEGATVASTMKIGSLVLGDESAIVDAVNDGGILKIAYGSVNAGKLAYYAIIGGTTATFATQLGTNWGKMSDAERAIGVATMVAPWILTVLPAMTQGTINRLSPNVLTGTSVSTGVDIARSVIPTEETVTAVGMSELAGRQLVQDIEQMQLTGTLPAQRINSLVGLVESLRFTQGDNTATVPLPQGVPITNEIKNLQNYTVQTITNLDSPQIRPLNFSDATDIARFVPAETIAKIQNYVKNNNITIYGSFVSWLKDPNAVQPHDIDGVLSPTGISKSQAVTDLLSILRNGGVPDAVAYDRGIRVPDPSSGNGWTTIINLNDAEGHAKMIADSGIDRILATSMTNEGIATETLGTQLVNQVMANLQGGFKAVQRGEAAISIAPIIVDIAEVADTAEITRNPYKGTVDIVLKSAKGNIVSRISGAQRVLAGIIYHATPNIQVLAQSLKDDGKITVGLKDESGQMAARPGMYFSPQASFTFLNRGEGTPSPGMIGLRLLPSDFREPPKEVMEQPTIDAMRDKFFELDRAGKLEKNVVYPVTKDYGKLATIEYETYVPQGSEFLNLGNKVAQSSITSQVGFGAATPDSMSLDIGQKVPIYWVGFKSAVDAGLKPPSILQMYAMKLLGDLTTIRQFAPWNIRGLRVPLPQSEEESGKIYTANPFRTAIKAIQLQAAPKVKSIMDEDVAIVNKVVQDAGNDPNKLESVANTSTALVKSALAQAQDASPDIISKMRQYQEFMHRLGEGEKLTDTENATMDKLGEDIPGSMKEPNISPMIVSKQSVSMTDEQAVNNYLQNLQNQQNTYYRGISSTQVGLRRNNLNFDSDYTSANEYAGSNGQLITATINAKNPIAFSELMGKIDLTEIEKENPGVTSPGFTDYIAKWDNYIAEQAKALGYDAIITSRGTHYEMQIINNDLVKETSTVSVQPQEVSESKGQVVEQKGSIEKTSAEITSMQDDQGAGRTTEPEETRGELPVKSPFSLEDIGAAEILTEGRNLLESKGEVAGNISERQYSLGRSLINTEGKTTSEGMLGSREGIKNESRINDEGISKGEANIVTEGRAVIGEEGIVEGRTYQPPYTPPYQPPYQPPYRPPFTSPPPPIQEKPTPPVLVKTSLSPSPEEKRRDAFAGATAWKQGFGYWAIKYPYTRKSDIAFFRKPPEGAEIVSGAGAAYRSIKLMTGKAPPKDLLIPLGIMTIRIRNPEAKAGKKGAIAYKMNKAAKRGKKTGSVRIVA